MEQLKMKKIIFVAALIILLISAACTCNTCGKQSELPSFPEKVKDGAALYIESQTGKDFFDKYIFPDLLHSKKVNYLYEMHYVFRMIDYDFVNEPIILYVDSTGTVDRNYVIKGIPNCRDNEEDCTFNINKEKAIEIAEQNNLSEGVRDWDVSFRWHSKFKKYVWHVISTTKEMGELDSKMYKAEGEEIVINPYDGKVLLQRDWKIN